MSPAELSDGEDKVQPLKIIGKPPLRFVLNPPLINEENNV